MIAHVREDGRCDDRKSSLSVSVSSSTGDTRIIEGEDAVFYVERYMPEKIREYFYFDGEQLDNYFHAGKQARIQETVYSISQVDMVSRAGQRLAKVIAKMQAEAANKAPNTKDINDKLKTSKDQKDAATRKIERLQNEIKKSEEIISKNSDLLRGYEDVPGLEHKYQQLKVRRDILVGDKRRLLLEEHVFLREKKIALTLYPAAKRTIEIINQKEKENSLPPDIDRNLLSKMLQEHKCLVCEHPLSNDDEEQIKSLLEKFTVSSVTSNVLMEIRSELNRIIASAKRYEKEKIDLFSRLERVKMSLNETNNEIQEIDNKLSALSDKSEIRRLHEERAEHEDLKRSNTESLGVGKKQLEAAKKSIEKYQSELNRALEKSESCRRITRKIRFAQRGVTVINSIEKEMMREVREKLERRTSEYFRQFIWKNNTYDRITLDEQYQLDLLHVDGYSCIGTAGAAESCLLALSFTLALHEVSGFDTQIFIDTPVARISDDNRRNFAEVLRDVSKNKQVIMTLTPDEYSAQVQAVFEDVVATSFKINTSDERITELR
ncbi:MAG: hypothetical protein HGA42_20065 [Nostocales cyanobacterium W4_Combined_metabat2_030]|nr:hypothetical protein [Nostocales cyanobacterium W4_Combined_metabat2_030]